MEITPEYDNFFEKAGDDYIKSNDMLRFATDTVYSKTHFCFYFIYKKFVYENYTPYLLRTIINLMVLFIGKMSNKEVKSSIKCYLKYPFGITD